MDQVKRSTTKIRRKAVLSGILAVFSNFDKCRQKVAGDAISGVFFGDAMLNSGPHQFYALLCSIQLHFAAYWKQLSLDVISGIFVGPIVPDKRVKFRDPHLNCSGEIQTKAVGGSIFGRFFFRTSINADR